MKVRMGIMWPGSLYHDNDWGNVYDLSTISKVEFVWKIQELVEELRQAGEGELVIVPARIA